MPHNFNITVTGKTGPGVQETTVNYFEATELVIDGLRDIIWFKDKNSVIHDLDLAGGGGLSVVINGTTVV